MPRELALAVCSGFVLLLLRSERDDSTGVSRTSWIPTLWMLAIATKPLGIWFGTIGDAESGSVPDRILLGGLAIAGLLVIAARRLDWRAPLRRQVPLLALLGFMFASAWWSDITAIALRRWARESVAVVMALVIVSDARPRQALESVLRRACYILVPFSLLLIKYYPRLGVEYGRWSGDQMWIGVALQKNGLGRLCLVTATFLVWSLYRRWRSHEPAAARYGAWSDGVVLLVALFLLKGSERAYSATSLGTFAFGMLLLAGLLALRSANRSVPRPILMASLVAVIAFGASTPFFAGANLAGLSSWFGRDDTLTGRTETWSQLVPVVKANPWLGAGFGSFWTTAHRQFYDMSHGHNGYLDILLDMGTLGLLLFTAWLLSCVRDFRDALTADDGWPILPISFMFIAAVYNVTESAFSGLTDQTTALILFASLVTTYEYVSLRGSHLGLRVHLPAQRNALPTADEPRLPANRRAVRVLDRRGGQRRRGIRPRDGGGDQGAVGR